MLLHRAVLSRLLSMTASESNANAEDFALGSASSSIDKCLEMARQTISIISQARHRQDILPVWWWSIYFCKSSPSDRETQLIVDVAQHLLPL